MPLKWVRLTIRKMMVAVAAVATILAVAVIPLTRESQVRRNLSRLRVTILRLSGHQPPGVESGIWDSVVARMAEIPEEFQSHYRPYHDAPFDLAGLERLVREAESDLSTSIPPQVLIKSWDSLERLASGDPELLKFVRRRRLEGAMNLMNTILEPTVSDPNKWREIHVRRLQDCRTIAMYLEFRQGEVEVEAYRAELEAAVCDVRGGTRRRVIDRIDREGPAARVYFEELNARSKAAPSKPR